MSTEQLDTEDAATRARTRRGDDPSDLWVERTGTRTYVGRNGRGAEVQIGPLENHGSFSPGELLKIALAGCTGLTTDAVIARRLGDDYPAVIEVAGVKELPADRYPHITENLVVDLSTLSDRDRDRLLTIVHRAAEEHCTVGRTVTAGAAVTLTVTDAVATAAGAPQVS